MADFNLIVFLEYQNLGIDNKIVLLSGLVPKLSSISYFHDYANLC